MLFVLKSTDLGRRTPRQVATCRGSVHDPPSRAKPRFPSQRGSVLDRGAPVVVSEVETGPQPGAVCHYPVPAETSGLPRAVSKYHSLSWPKALRRLWTQSKEGVPDPPTASSVVSVLRRSSRLHGVWAHDSSSTPPRYPGTRLPPLYRPTQVPTPDHPATPK